MKNYVCFQNKYLEINFMYNYLIKKKERCFLPSNEILNISNITVNFLCYINYSIIIVIYFVEI